MSQPASDTPAQPKSRRALLRSAIAGAGAIGGGLIVRGFDALSEGAAIKPNGLSRARPVPNDAALPEAVDVAIIGGGYVGAAAALNLAERGVSVALFEKGVIAGEASGRSGGLVECAMQAPEKLELIEYSKQAWRNMATRTGEETGFSQLGTRILSASEGLLAATEAWIEQTRGGPNGGARMLSAAEAQSMAPGATARFKGGCEVPEDGGAEPVYAAPAMAIGARKAGATIHQFCAVRGIELSGGRVSGVITEAGRVRASTVILAGGVWSPMMADALGLDIPILQCFSKGTSLAPFDGPNGGSSTTISAKYDVGWRKQFDGGYQVWEFKAIIPILPAVIANVFDLMPALQANGAVLRPRFNLGTFWRWMKSGAAVPLDRPGVYEQTRIYEPEVWTEGIDTGFQHLKEVMPAFRWAPIRERWAGSLQTTPDNMPILSGVDAIPGLILGTGFFYGLTMGAGAGAVLADLATGATPAISLENYRFRRFSDASKLRYHA